MFTKPFAMHLVLRKFLFVSLLSLSLVGLNGCADLADDELLPQQEWVMDFGFNNNLQNWEGNFADYPVGGEEVYELYAGHDALPSSVDSLGMGLLLSGINYNQDLFFFWHNRIGGLRPNSAYAITYDLEVIVAGDFSRRETFMKYGATPEKPERVIDAELYRLNLDKGEGTSDGKDMFIFPEAVVEDRYSDGLQRIRYYNYEKVCQAVTDEEGQLWLVLGADSFKEGAQFIFVDRLTVTLREVE
jgi:hypothetical protein